MRTYDYGTGWGGFTELIVTINNNYDEDECKRKKTTINDWRRAKQMLDLLNKYPELLETGEFTSKEFSDIVNGERSKEWLLDIRDLKIFNMLSNNNNRVRLGDYPNGKDEDSYPIFKKVREENFKVKTPKYQGMGTRYYFAVDEEGVEILEDYVNMFAPCLVVRENNKILEEQEKLARLQRRIEKKTKKIAKLLEKKALAESEKI